jgi:hypothetical protein
MSMHLLFIEKKLTASTAHPVHLFSIGVAARPALMELRLSPTSTLAEIKRFIRRKYAVIVSYIWSSSNFRSGKIHL